MRYLIFLLLISLTNYEVNGQYRNKKEIKQAKLEIKKFRQLYKNLVKVELPDYVIEMPVINNNLIGSIIDYEVINLSNRSENVILNNGFAKDSDMEPDIDILNSYLENLNENEIFDVFKSKEILYGNIYILIPIQTNRIHSKSDSINKKLKEFYLNNFEDKKKINTDHVRNLINSDLYIKNFNRSSISNFILDSLNKRLKYLISISPERFRGRIKNAKIAAVDSNSKIFEAPLGLRNNNQNIIISSELLRATIVDLLLSYSWGILRLTSDDLIKSNKVLINLTYNELQNYKPKNVLNKKRYISNKTEYFSDMIELKLAHRSFYSNLYRYYDFVFLHELAHIYLGQDGLDESLCDCYAFSILKSINPNINANVDLGIFLYYLVNSSNSKFWFESNNKQVAKDLRQRLDKLNYLNKNNLLCK